MSRRKTPFFDKKYLSRVLLGVAVFLFSLGVLIYVGYHMAGSTRDGIDIMYARSESVPRRISGYAYIIRDEIPLSGPAAGGVYAAAVRDGEKVSVGQRVADAYGNASEATLDKIRLVEEQIKFYEKCRDTHMSVGDTSVVRRDIASAVLDISRSLVSGSAGEAMSMKSPLALDIRRLGVLSGKITDFNVQIASLEGELAALRASLGNITSTVYAPSSGYYFSEIDGYEGVFSSARIDSVTYSDIISMIDSASSVDPVPADNSPGKMVGDYRWYAACRMSAVDAAAFVKDSRYEVTLKNNRESIMMSVYKVLTDAREAVVLFESAFMPEDFDYTRCQQFEAVFEEQTGFRIPVSALRMYDGEEGVYILDEVTVRFRRVHVLEEENGFFLCSATDPLDVPYEDGDEEGTETSADTSSAEPKSKYYYLRENDIIIKSGTGLYVGMTYNPKK